MTPVSSINSIDNAWAQHRPYLVSLAFRMLGDIGDAEDAVQEAFVRLMATEVSAIDDARGWLTVVTSRLCLDQIRSARRRLQRPQDLDAISAQLPGSGSSFVDPADRVTLDDSVRLALIVVLDRLTPAERVVFVLREIFGVPFETVAETVGRTGAACRQLARRARVKIDAAVGSGDVGLASAEHRLVTERFIQACATGDLEALLQVLDPAVSGEVDLRPGEITSGAELVAQNMLRYWGHAQLVALTTGGEPVLLAFIDRTLRAVIALTVAGDRVREIHATVQPAHLKSLREALPD